MPDHFDRQMISIMDWENFDFEGFYNFIDNRVCEDKVVKLAERLHISNNMLSDNTREEVCDLVRQRLIIESLNKFIKKKLKYDMNSVDERVPNIMYMIREKLEYYYTKLRTNENTPHTS